MVVIPAEASSPDSEPITDLVEMDAASQVSQDGGGSLDLSPGLFLHAAVRAEPVGMAPGTGECHCREMG